MEQANPMPNPATPPQIPVNPPASQPVNTPSSNKPVLIVLLVVGLVVLSSLATYFILKSQSKPQAPVSSPSTIQPSSTQPSTVIPSPSSPVDPTAGWKTYEDKAAGVSFKYPSDWYAKALSGTFSVFLENRPFEIASATEFLTSIQVGFNEAVNTVTNKKFIQEKTLEEGLERYKQLYDQNSVKIENTTVGGKRAAQISGELVGMFQGEYAENTLVQLDNKLLHVFLAPNKKEFKNIYDQILSTFKFN